MNKQLFNTYPCKFEHPRAYIDKMKINKLDALHKYHGHAPDKIIYETKIEHEFYLQEATETCDRMMMSMFDTPLNIYCSEFLECICIMDNCEIYYGDDGAFVNCSEYEEIDLKYDIAIIHKNNKLYHYSNFTKDTCTDAVDDVKKTKDVCAIYAPDHIIVCTKNANIMSANRVIQIYGPFDAGDKVNIHRPNVVKCLYVWNPYAIMHGAISLSSMKKLEYLHIDNLHDDDDDDEMSIDISNNNVKYITLFVLPHTKFNIDCAKLEYLYIAYHGRVEIYHINIINAPDYLKIMYIDFEE